MFTPAQKFFFDDVIDVETWGGFSLTEAMETKAMWEYLRLSLSGLLSMTEWWYVREIHTQLTTFFARDNVNRCCFLHAWFQLASGIPYSVLCKETRDLF